MLLPPAAIANSKKSQASFFDGNYPTSVGHVGHQVLFGSTFFFLFFIFFHVFETSHTKMFVLNGENPTYVALSAVACQSYRAPGAIWIRFFLSFLFIFFHVFETLHIKMFILNGNNPTFVAL